MSSCSRKENNILVCGDIKKIKGEIILIPSYSFKTVSVLWWNAVKNNNRWIVYLFRKQQSWVSWLKYNFSVQMALILSAKPPNETPQRKVKLCVFAFTIAFLNMLSQLWLWLDSCSGAELASVNKLTSSFPPVIYWALGKKIPDLSTPSHIMCFCVFLEAEIKQSLSGSQSASCQWVTSGCLSVRHNTGTAGLHCSVKDTFVVTSSKTSCYFFLPLTTKTTTCKTWYGQQRWLI